MSSSEDPHTQEDAAVLSPTAVTTLIPDETTTAAVADQPPADGAGSTDVAVSDFSGSEIQQVPDAAADQTDLLFGGINGRTTGSSDYILPDTNIAASEPVASGADFDLLGFGAPQSTTVEPSNMLGDQENIVVTVDPFDVFSDTTVEHNAVNADEFASPIQATEDCHQNAVTADPLPSFIDNPVPNENDPVAPVDRFVSPNEDVSATNREGNTDTGASLIDPAEGEDMPETISTNAIDPPKDSIPVSATEEFNLITEGSSESKTSSVMSVGQDTDTCRNDDVLVENNSGDLQIENIYYQPAVELGDNTIDSKHEDPAEDEENIDATEDLPAQSEVAIQAEKKKPVVTETSTNTSCGVETAENEYGELLNETNSNQPPENSGISTDNKGLAESAEKQSDIVDASATSIDLPTEPTPVTEKIDLTSEDLSEAKSTEETIAIHSETKSGAATEDEFDGTGIVKRKSAGSMDEINLNEPVTDTQDNIISKDNIGPPETTGVEPNEIDATVDSIGAASSEPAPTESVPASDENGAIVIASDCVLGQSEPNFNISDTVEQPTTLNLLDQIEEDNASETVNIVVDRLPNDVSIQNASTEEEAEWLSMGLGLSDALKQIIALTDERDVALAMCQEREGQSSFTAQSEALLVELQSRLQSEMDRRAESDSEVRKLREEIKRYEDQLTRYSTLEDDYEKVQANLVMVVSEKSKLEGEIEKLREFKDESEQKEVILSSRLNEAKKKEANKSTAAGRLEAENETLKEELAKAKAELDAMTKAKAKVESNMEKLKAKAVERVKQAETALAEERELNEERKRKMKTFVESKAEELREAKESASDMQIELQETRTSLRSSREREESFQKELEASRIKYRELQRDMERLKRNQEEMHKMGSTLEHELEKSASETEEHKKKRMSAKHELMTMVRTLEVEKSVNGKLRESIKFTFTPKALSQQQLLTECLKDFEVELERLATKLGKTLVLPPQSSEHTAVGESSGTAAIGSPDVNGAAKKLKKHARAAKADNDTERLISNLENETQHVSKGIMSLAGSIERMRSLLNEDFSFNCMAYFSNILAAGMGQQEARHQRLGDSVDHDEREETVSITSFDQG